MAWSLSEKERADTAARIAANLATLAFFRGAADVSDAAAADAAAAIERKAYNAATVAARTTTGARPAHELAAAYVRTLAELTLAAARDGAACGGAAAGAAPAAAAAGGGEVRAQRGWDGARHAAWLGLCHAFNTQHMRRSRTTHTYNITINTPPQRRSTTSLARATSSTPRAPSARSRRCSPPAPRSAACASAPRALGATRRPSRRARLALSRTALSTPT